MANPVPTSTSFTEKNTISKKNGINEQKDPKIARRTTLMVLSINHYIQSPFDHSTLILGVNSSCLTGK